MRRMIFVTGFSAAIALVSPVAAAPAPPSTMTGVYTAAQAAEGKVVYDGACAMCHGPNLRGSFEAPPLTGRLIANWAGGSVGGLHSYVQKAMPLFAPGSLSAEVDAKIVAYILQTNGYPAGAKPLPADSAALAKIRFAPLTPARLIQTNSTGDSK
jgi:mono/diheme cytochrome c family protein